MTGPQIRSFFDTATNSVSYVVADPTTNICAVIDPVLDYDAATGRIGRRSVDGLLAFIRAEGLSLHWALETHAHADHVSAGDVLRRETGAKIGIGAKITEVQTTFAPLFNIKDLPSDGRQFDRLLADGDTVAVGNLSLRVMHTPGHTPACVTYLVGDAAFVGDTMFMPDYGSARVDFPGGSAAQLYRSVRKILSLPENTRIFCCHDYKAAGRDKFAWETTVAQQRRANLHVRDGITEEDFVAMRTARDKTLNMPALLIPAIQLNLRAGALPPAEENGVAYVKVPLNAV